MKVIKPTNILLLKAGEKLSPQFLEKMKNINAAKRKMGFVDYRSALTELVHSGERGVDEPHRRFLGGFILGEGSINVSLKRDRYTKLGVSLDPQFSVTQHINQSSHLMACLDVFQTGRIYHKSGSNATLVYVMESRQSLHEKLLPFWDKYIAPYQHPQEKQRLQTFKQLLLGLEKKHHLCLDTFVNTLLPLWHSLRKQQGQSNESFPDLESAQRYVRDFHANIPHA